MQLPEMPLVLLLQEFLQEAGISVLNYINFLRKVYQKHITSISCILSIREWHPRITVCVDKTTN